MVLTCGFGAGRGWLSWLRQRERDRDADEVEGLPLFAGGLGEHRDVGGGAGEPDLVAGQGGRPAATWGRNRRRAWSTGPVPLLRMQGHPNGMRLDPARIAPRVRLIAMEVQRTPGYHVVRLPAHGELERARQDVDEFLARVLHG